MPQKINKKFLIPAVLIGTGAALYFLNKNGKLDKLKNLIQGTTIPEISPPANVTPANVTPAIVTPAVVTPAVVTPAAPLIGLAYKVGDKVNAIRLARTYPGYTLVSQYTTGATDGNGNYLPGNYVGVVTQIVGKAVKVTRASAPFPEVYNTFTPNTKIGEFWVLNIMIEKSLI